MRVVILADRIPPQNLGGAEKIAWRLAQGLQGQGHEVHIITATEKAAFEEERAGITIYHLHSHYPLRWRAWLSLYNPQTLSPLRRLLRRIQPDVVNAHNVHQDLSYASITTAQRMGLPVVFSAHDCMTFAYSKLTHFIDPQHCGAVSPAAYRLPLGYNLRQMRWRYNPLRNVLIRRVLAQYTRVRIAISQTHRQALEANDLPPFRVIYHGFDSAAYPYHATMAENLRARWGLVDKKVVLFGGRLTELKGSRQLLAALDRLIPTMPELRLLVLSPQPFEPYWLEGLQNFKQEHICEGGWLGGDDLLAAFHLADLIPVPSICLDTLPTTLFESMAVGKPSLATCYGGSPEIVLDGKTGFVINPFDTPVFAQRIETLLRDDALRHSMGAAAQAHLDAHFNFATQLEQTQQAYQDAISR